MNLPRIKIHAEKEALAPGQPHVVMLFPFWGKNPETPGAPDTGRFDEYATRGADLFEMVSLEEAEAAVLAGEWRAGGGTDQARAYCEKARRAGKRVVIFFNNDSDEKIDVENAVIFRTSGYRSQKRPEEHGLTAWCEDFVEVYSEGNFIERKKQEKPVVGYCGYGAVDGIELPDLLNRILRKIPKARRWANRQRGAGEVLRTRGLRSLHRSTNVETNFILRETFWAGAIAGGQFDVERGKQARVEYVRNMFESDYVLCARGAGNFSFRFYETLCSGRIPLFINTDCILPYERWIDWKKYCVWVEEKELGKIAEKLVDFHRQLTGASFEQRLRECRELWLEWLSPLGFFKQLHRYLR